MSLSLEELCAMVNVSYEEVKSIRVNSGREGVQHCAGIVECMQQGHNVLEQQDKSTAEAEIISSSDSEEYERHWPKGKRGAANWKRNVQKRRRMEGKSYSGKQKDVGEVTRAARILGPGCVSEACKKSAKRFCHTFSEEDRHKIFQHFWQKMTWAERRTYVSGLVDHTPVARKRSASQDSRRLSTLSYHLSVDGERRRVCKKFFLSTLGLGEWSVAHWVQTSESENNTSKAAVENEALASLQAFLRDLPKVPSHYCQTSSSKLYLEPMFQSMSELHRVYTRYCEEELQTTPLSREILMEEFNHLNLALYHPKKQLCNDDNSSQEAGNEGEKVWQNHCLIKEEQCEEHAKDKATDSGKMMVSCMDLQALLLCPKLKASSFYCETKLAVHNFTHYNMVSTRQEGEGKECSSNITDSLHQHQQYE